MSLPCISHYIPVDGFFGLPIRPFGLLVGCGVLLGYSLGRRRARLTGLDPDLCANGMVWTVVAGFIGAHLVSVLVYYPQDIQRDPFVLFKFWRQLSSFGGFLGASIGAFIYFRKYGASLLKYADAIIFGLVPGWVFGRLGCTVVHDHPGGLTDFFLGVRCGPAGAVVHDLGLYEALYAMLLTAVLYALGRFRPFHGFHVALMLLLYSPVRFVFDRLRVEDTRYWGATPGEYFAVGAVVVAAALTVYGLRLRAAGDRPVPVGTVLHPPAPEKASPGKKRRRASRR